MKAKNKIKADKIVSLTAEQKRLLMASEQDIRYGRITTQEKLDEEDLKWLNGITSKT